MSRLRLKAEQVPTVIGYFLVALAAGCLLRWVYQEQTWPFIGAKVHLLKANAAIAVGFTGLAFLRHRYRDANIYSMIVWAIGTFTFLQYLTGIDFGIDELLVKDMYTQVLPGRMSALTSFGFLLTGTALALMKSKKSWVRDASRWLGLLLGGIGLTTIFGYSFGATALYRPNPNRNLSFFGALAFVVIALGVNYCNFSESWLVLVHARSNAGKMLRRLLPVAVLFPFFIILAVSILNRHFNWGRELSMALISGSVVFALVIAIFIDARAIEREEAARRESEENFRLAADTAPVMIWRSSTDKRCDYVNRQWLEFTGRTIEQELGNGWVEGVHGEDLDGCLKTYVSSFDKRQPFKVQFRLRHHDGEYRWVIGHGVPRHLPQGSFAGYVGSCIDITEQKMAEEALSEFGRSLIRAQDEERNWIAQEIHDDYQQRLALLAIHLQTLAQNPDSARGAISSRLRELWTEVQTLATDLQLMAHRLHSSALKRVGLTAGLRALCAEYTDHLGITVTFEAENVQQPIPDEISLCLYRVTQEALQNIKKHSGAKAAEVRVFGKNGSIHLSISDTGKGFSADSISKTAGLGIQSMIERVRLVGGRLELSTQEEEGSRIDAWVPVETQKPVEA